MNRNIIRTGVIVALLTTTGVSGCAGGNTANVADSSTPLTSTSSGTPSASPKGNASPVVVSAKPTLTAGQQRVVAANQKVTAALFGLTAASRNVKDATALTAPRQAVATALNATRLGLTNERTAAYGTAVRSCTAVGADAAAARAGAVRVAGAVTMVYPVTARMRAGVTALQASMATVNTELAALRSALAAEPKPPAVVSVTSVQAALAAATTLVSQTLTTASGAEAKAASDLANARQMSAQASTIQTKAC